VATWLHLETTCAGCRTNPADHLRPEPDLTLALSIHFRHAAAMAFRQYTKCVEPAKFTKFSRVARILIAAGASAVLAALLAILAGEPLAALIGLWIGALVAMIAYCVIWHYNRLICLGGDVEVVGVVARLSPPSRTLTDWDWDTDYSIDLLLQNAPFGSTQVQAEQSQPYGQLVATTPALTAIGRATPGHSAGHGTIRTFGLHVEFEGRGNRTLQDLSVASLVVAVAALVAGMAGSGGLAGILVAVSIAIGVLGLLAGKYLAAGSPSDVNPNIGSLNPIQLDANNNPLPGADIVYVKGTWVYDSLHEGWNEIHPIKEFRKVATWTGNWQTQPPIRI